MSGIIVFLDAAMCLLWIATYILVLIGTVKYRYPLISSATQLVIAPFEFVMLLMMLGGGFRADYITGAYFCWTAVEIAVICVIVKSARIRTWCKGMYILAVCLMTNLMYYLVVLRGWNFFFSYFNTFVGVLLWFGYFLKRDYPEKPLVLAAVVTKLLADTISIPVYFGKGGWATDLLIVLLAVLDFAFLLVCVERWRTRRSKRIYATAG